MKTLSLISSLVLSLTCTSCYYRNHLPVSSATDPEPKIVSIKVGERRKIISKTILTEISPGYMMGPSYYLKSSDPSVVAIEDDSAGRIAWLRAISPGSAVIHYSDGGLITPVVVKPETSQIKR